MKDLKKIYAHFNILERNQDNELTKVTYSSLDKYNGSPYLQRIFDRIQELSSIHTKKQTGDKLLQSKSLTRNQVSSTKA